MSNLDTVRESFTQRIPMMQRAARIGFLRLPAEARQEAIANSLALAWKFFYALYLKGRADEPEILRSCIWYAVRQTKSGRTVQEKNRSKDAMDNRRTGKARFVEFDLDQFVARTTPIPEQVWFRIDVPKFLDTLTDRQRRIAIDLASGMATTEAASKYNVSPGRISQFRAKFKKLFDEFFAE